MATHREAPVAAGPDLCDGERRAQHHAAVGEGHGGVADPVKGGRRRSWRVSRPFI